MDPVIGAQQQTSSRDRQFFDTRSVESFCCQFLSNDIAH